jgi:hypothetical protein
MKSFFMVALLCTVACQSIAQWNPNNQTTGNIYYNGGNVGIGIANPNTKIHTDGVVKSSHFSFDNINVQVDGTYLPVIRFTRWTGLNQEQHNAFVGQFYNTPLNQYSFGIGTGFSDTGDQTATSTILTATLNGKIGIGNSTPSANLDVTTSLPAPSVYNTQNWSTNNQDYLLQLQTVWDNDGINQRIVQKFAGVNYTSLSFFKGNVGIGTTNPDAKLAVKGTVHAEEVKVDLQVPGPDYVFEPTYQLPSLTEIENYIKANKHLPEVPSAKEMETNGINLSEMNMLLLKKVEELTLHIIDQGKLIDKLQQEKESNNLKLDQILLHIAKLNQEIEKLKSTK